MVPLHVFVGLFVGLAVYAVAFDFDINLSNEQDESQQDELQIENNRDDSIRRRLGSQFTENQTFYCVSIENSPIGSVNVNGIYFKVTEPDGSDSINNFDQYFYREDNTTVFGGYYFYNYAGFSRWVVYHELLDSGLSSPNAYCDVNNGKIKDCDGNFYYDAGTIGSMPELVPNATVTPYANYGDCYQTTSPSKYPSTIPTSVPSNTPTQPTSNPSSVPTLLPSSIPSMVPSVNPSANPSNVPTSMPITLIESTEEEIDNGMDMTTTQLDTEPEATNESSVVMVGASSVSVAVTLFVFWITTGL